MALKNNFVIFLVFVGELCSVAVGGSLYSSPQILLAEKEYVLEKNESFTIFCQGNKPLTWTLPSPKDPVKQKWTTHTIKAEKANNPMYKYGSRLKLYNMSYPFVGFYSCHFQDGQDIADEDSDSNKVYLFVNDKENLKVENNQVNIDNIYVQKGDVALIPCRPTAPDVEVKLFMIDSDNIEDDDNVPYDNKLGFSFVVSDVNQMGSYMCTFSKGNETFEMIYTVELDQKTSYIPTPNIVDENKGHTTIGDTIKLNCSPQYTKINVMFDWDTPTGFDPKRMKKTDTPNESTLTVLNATKNDRGVYTCLVYDHQKHRNSRNITMTVFDKNFADIFMKERTDTYRLEVRAGKDQVTWVVEVWGHPQTKFTWLNNRNETIPQGKGKKYEVETTAPQFYSPDQRDLISLKIKNLAIGDFGTYTLMGSNRAMVKPITFFLNVTAGPVVIVQTDPFHLVGVPGKVTCTAAAHPSPDFQWEYKSCLQDTCQYKPIEGKIISTEGVKVTSEIEVNPKENGLAKCIAVNSIGQETDIIGYFVTDVPDGFAITGFDDTVIVDAVQHKAIYAFGEKIHVVCSATLSNYSEVSWNRNGGPIPPSTRLKLSNKTSEYSSSSILEIGNSNISDKGTYKCVARTATGYKSKDIEILIVDPVNAQITDTNMKGEMMQDFPNPVMMHCGVTGVPKPHINWYKDNVLFVPTDPRIVFEDERQTLRFNETKIEDAGKYKCEAAYKDIRDFREVKLSFSNAPGPRQDWLIYIILFLFLALICVGIFLFLKVRKERRLKQEMKLLGLANFEKGAVENINPELGIDDQAELLPYDRKWEFPIEQLKLGKQLGSGAFGVVLKGEAKCIVEGEPVTTVAVKMVKKNADNTYIKALASELKIMAHLGKHLNVVNLLGACTKNVAKRELLVIVEYCRFGNLQNYLLRHREHFINQIDPHTGKVNYMIGHELLDRTYSISSNRSQVQSPLMRYATLAFSDSTNSAGLPPPNTMGDYRAHAGSDNTDMTTVTQGDDGVVLSNNSVQPEWRSNYKGDYKGNINPISTKDLIAYAFQVARGMEYLASRKVLHGDLAARNILLSDENIVKICDFGLAKSMYKNDNYKKRGDTPLPVKWMAIESIRDRVFSTQSDVWSYGIVLWELFSLGRTPYPGMEADERLYHKLLDGYRLESPEYSPKEVYQIMTECWLAKPVGRPSFTKLTERIGTLLEETLRKHYIDLNDPYLVMNTKMLEGQSDYLSMLSPPTFDVIVSPHYVNDIMTQQPAPDEGYMSMKPNTIFSPRITEDEVFNFTPSNRKNLTSEGGKAQELLPMLHVISEADTETPLNSPTRPSDPNSISNPMYHLPPTILNDCTNGQTEIVKSADNYVSMPQSKNLIKDRSAQENKPAMDEKKESHRYVNDGLQDWTSIKV
ncbi:vascular endothelial growth factor receptor 1 isoform X2 [Diabrotica virgifera virgifera]|uniref:receptor protein-tyrosine kinase n=1 Tax=Diabrotica virgifera virgifera TaxID=50390 RepID=A0ABM5KGE7_DIAVI|nr:vascular endothelial growth factor receptor 1 isoform X2 [Diabrotica virgifera virgifera]